MKCLFICALILLGFVYGQQDYIGRDEDFEIIDSIAAEEPCIKEGGSCTIAADCPKSILSEKKGLCPKQRNMGVECCHGLSVKETRCYKHGGRCMSHDYYCNPNVVFKGATNCPVNHKCCIFVN